MFYDFLLPKVIFSPSFLFFLFFPPSFSFPLSKPFDYFPPPTGRGNTEQYTGLRKTAKFRHSYNQSLTLSIDDSLTHIHLTAYEFYCVHCVQFHLFRRTHLRHFTTGGPREILGTK